MGILATATHPLALPRRQPPRGGGGALRALQGLIAADLALGDRAGAGRLVLRCLRRPRILLSWLDAVEDLRRTCGLAAAPADLVRKPTQSFLWRGLSSSERTSLLKAHYALLLERFGPSLVATWLAGGAVDLQIAGKTGAPFKLRISRSHLNRREGELHLVLLEGQGDRRLASLALVFGDGPNGPVLYIGGLQGRSGEDARAATVRATRALYGLRPKDLLVHAAYALAARAGAGEVAGVGSRAHVHADPRGGPGWAFDYDAFWRDLGGALRPDGFHSLPAVRPRRAAGEVDACRLKAWRLKYALVDALALRIAGLGLP